MIKFLLRLAIRSGLISRERIIRAMGFTPPSGIPVPIVHVQEIGWRFGFVVDPTKKKLDLVRTT